MAAPLTAGLVLCIVFSCAAVMAAELPEQYTEPFAKSYPIRKRQHLQMKEYLDSFTAPSVEKAEAEFKLDFSGVDQYERSVASVRAYLHQMSGYPPPKAVENPVPRFELVAKDKVADIYRVWVEVMEGVEAYGIYMVPRDLKGNAPLLIALHGGSGCPEAVCDLDTRINYAAFGREAAKRGYIVWAPGLLMRVTYANPPDPVVEGMDWRQLREKARSVGTSTAVLQVYEIARGVEAIAKARPEADGERIGMVGLSMGGGYTLTTMAYSPLIKVGVCSAAFAQRGPAAPAEGVDIESFQVGERLGRPQLVALICPRPLMIQSGVEDSVVPVAGARRAVPRAEAYYKKLGIEDRFEYSEHAGGHVFENEAIFRFFDKHLR